MVKIHGINNFSNLHKEYKTTIRNGEIYRETIWKDSIGNEFEKVRSNLVMKKPVMDLPFHLLPSDHHFEIQLPMVNEPDFVVCVLLFMLVSFLVGFALGSKRRRGTEIEIENPEAPKARSLNSVFS
jgi:hypothetical protein